MTNFTDCLANLTNNYQAQQFKFVAYGYDVLISSIKEFFNSCPEMYCIEWNQRKEDLDTVSGKTFYKDENEYYLSKEHRLSNVGIWTYSKVKFASDLLSHYYNSHISEERSIEIYNNTVEFEKFLNTLNLDIYKDNFGSDSKVFVFKDYIEVKVWKEDTKEYVSDFITYL